MWSRGAYRPGSSALAMVTSISPIDFALRYVSAVPHAPQNVRVTASEERNSTGFPRVKTKPESGKLIQATTGAPEARRHVAQ